MSNKNEIKNILMKMSRDCVAVRMKLLNRIITNIYDSSLKPLGIKLTQLNILIVTYLYDEIGYDELAKKLIMEKSTASRNVDRMVKKGWLEVSLSNESNKKMIKATKIGEELLQKVYEFWNDGQKKATALLGDELTNTLILAGNKVWKAKKQK